MKTLMCVIGCLMVLSIQAHTVKTASGAIVTHAHQSSTACVNGICPNSFTDSSFEQSNGFLSSEKIFSKNSSWNCHGRTFDGRRSWISLADPWVNNEYPVCPSNPKIGDSVVWFKNGKTYHSATIVSAWNGTSTKVMSKYGMAGQYKHALAKCIAAYAGPGVSWTVLRFPSSTIIYQGKQSENQKIQSIEELVEAGRNAPWGSVYSESDYISKTEGKRIFDSITSLRESTIYAFENDPENDNISTLFDDLLDDSHYIFAFMYNSPEFTEHYIQGLEASEILVDYAFTSESSRQEIINKSLDLLTQESLGTNTVVKKGVLLDILNQVLFESDRSVVKENLKKSLPEMRPNLKTNEVPTYTEYYFNLL